MLLRKRAGCLPGFLLLLFERKCLEKLDMLPGLYPRTPPVRRSAERLLPPVAHATGEKAACGKVMVLIIPGKLHETLPQTSRSGLDLDNRTARRRRFFLQEPDPGRILIINLRTFQLL